MCWMNFWTALYYGLWMFGPCALPGRECSGGHLVDFCRRHPDALVDIALFCMCGAVGQLFIYFTIKTFGSLVNTLICTTRKFFNILLSVVWNANPLLANQWLGVGMVFTGLLAHTLLKAYHKPKKAAGKVAKAD